MRYGQGKWTLRWTEHWLSFWAPRVVPPVVCTPQRADGGLNTFISDLGDGRGHIPSKSAQETGWGGAASCNSDESQQAGQKDREQRRVDLGRFKQYIQISDEGEKGKQSDLHSGIQ